MESARRCHLGPVGRMDGCTADIVSVCRNLCWEWCSHTMHALTLDSFRYKSSLMHTLHRMPNLTNACTRSDNGYQCAAYDRVYDRKSMDFLTGPGFLSLDWSILQSPKHMIACCFSRRYGFLDILRVYSGGFKNDPNPIENHMAHAPHLSISGWRCTASCSFLSMVWDY